MKGSAGAGPSRVEPWEWSRCSERDDDLFDRVEVGTVRWQEDEPDSVDLALADRAQNADELARVEQILRA